MRISGALSLTAVLLLTGGCGVFGGTPAPTAPLTESVGAMGTGTANPDPGQTAEPPAPVPSAAPITSEAGPTIDATKHDLTAWASPSGNIVCAASREKSAAVFEIRCDVMEHTWKVPPKPASCEFDWGHGTFLNTKSGITCVSDAIAGTDSVDSEATWWRNEPGAQVMTLPLRKAVTLGYGTTLNFGVQTCTSQLDGMHCTNTTTKAGFDINRTAYTLR